MRLLKKNSSLVPVRNEIKLAEAIKKLFENTKLRTQMGKLIELSGF